MITKNYIFELTVVPQQTKYLRYWIMCRGESEDKINELMNDFDT